MEKTRTRIISGWRQKAGRPGVRKNEPRPTPRTRAISKAPIVVPPTPAEKAWEAEGGSVDTPGS
jgi:hypothetical protein